MLEANLWSDNAFVTLTYDEDKMPRLEDGRGVLLIEEHQNFMKRLRKGFSEISGGKKIRFYGVGEYGDNSWRPHFHYALFNFPNCRFGHSTYSRVIKDCCVVCDLVRDTWGRGNILVAELNTNTAQYVCGYVTKKMTAKDDPRLKGLPPEFARMSLRPGIGGDAMHDVASTLMQFNLDDKQGDVPSTLRHGKRILPLGRYLQKRLRRFVGRDEKAPQEVLDKLKADLQPLRTFAFNASLPLKGEIIKAADQAVVNMEKRAEIFKSRKDKL